MRLRSGEFNHFSGCRVFIIVPGNGPISGIAWRNVMAIDVISRCSPFPFIKILSASAGSLLWHLI